MFLCPLWIQNFKVFEFAQNCILIEHYTTAIYLLYDDGYEIFFKLVLFRFFKLKISNNVLKCVFFVVKGWIRKGKILQGMQQPSKALSAYQKALELDASNAVRSFLKFICFLIN